MLRIPENVFLGGQSVCGWNKTYASMKFGDLSIDDEYNVLQTAAKLGVVLKNREGVYFGYEYCRLDLFDSKAYKNASKL